MERQTRKIWNFLDVFKSSDFLDERISDYFTRHFISPKYGMTFRHPSRRHCAVTLNIFQSTLIPGFEAYVLVCSKFLSHMFRKLR